MYRAGRTERFSFVFSLFYFCFCFFRGDGEEIREPCYDSDAVGDRIWLFVKARHRCHGPSGCMYIAGYQIRENTHTHASRQMIGLGSLMFLLEQYYGA